MMKFMLQQEMPFVICTSQPYLANQCRCLYTLISLKAEVLRSVKQENKVHELDAVMYNTICFGEL